MSTYPNAGKEPVPDGPPLMLQAYEDAKLFKLIIRKPMQKNAKSYGSVMDVEVGVLVGVVEGV